MHGAAAAPGPGGRRVGDFYASWLDEAAIERRGIAAARLYLARIAAVRDRAGLLPLFFGAEVATVAIG